MKKLVVDGEGLVGLLGQRVVLFCTNYFYTGVLDHVNDDCVLLKEAAIVYETGSFTESGWKDAQRLPGESWYVQTASIESFGMAK